MQLITVIAIVGFIILYVKWGSEAIKELIPKIKKKISDFKAKKQNKNVENTENTNEQ